MKFKVGDIVKVVGLPNFKYLSRIGKVVTLKSEDGTYSSYLYLRKVAFEDEYIWINICYLELYLKGSIFDEI